MDFINKLDTYKPHEYILENLSPEKCGERLIELITPTEKKNETNFL